MSPALFLLAAIGVGADVPRAGAMDAGTTECPFADSSTWELVLFEEEGKQESRRGKLETGPKGKRVLHISPYEPWTIVASRVAGEGPHWPVALDSEWGGEFAGRTTIHGIYTLCGSYCRFCFTDKGSPRPTQFATAPGSGRTLLVFKRKR
jgi:hypothetical protein